MKRNEIEIDITDEVATYSVKELISLLQCLEKNGFSKTYFDGYNASICVYKTYQPERLENGEGQQGASDGM